MQHRDRAVAGENRRTGTPFKIGRASLNGKRHFGCRAQVIYAQSWAQALLSRGDGGQCSTDRAMALSPIDPLRYAMLATRALSHLVRDDAASALSWAERAAREPGAHALIDVIAGVCNAAAGDIAHARDRITIARIRQPSLTPEKFFQSFPFSDAEVRKRIGALLKQSGL